MEINGMRGYDPGQEVGPTKEYIAKYGIKFPFITPAYGGGESFFSTNGFSYGGSTYLIKPDRTWETGPDYAAKNPANPSDVSGAVNYLKLKVVQPYINRPEVTPPAITVSAPAANAVLTVGATKNIQWNATDNKGVASRAIQFSSNSGSSWILVDSQVTTSGAGTFQWKVPDAPSKICKIMINVYDAAKNRGSDTSGIFTIAATGTISNPAVIQENILLIKTLNALALYIPVHENSTVTVSDLAGRMVTSFSTDMNKCWYSIKQPESSGIYIVSIKCQTFEIHKKVWFTPYN